MKEYTTSEMIAELEKNPKLRFKEVEGEFGETLYCEVSEYGYIRLTTSDNESQDFSGNIMPSAKWTRVRTPVTWQEAIQAWTDGKTITCHILRDKPYKYPGTNCQLIADNGHGITSSEINIGIWYIEEDCE